jgi:hypothetical protein
MALPNRTLRRRLILFAMTVAAAVAWPQLSFAERALQPRTETEGQAPPSSEDLRRRLDKSDGVIRPPESIDPDIHAPAPQPNPGTTPVIPPPGTPGGDQSIRPK